MRPVVPLLLHRSSLQNIQFKKYAIILTGLYRIIDPVYVWPTDIQNIQLFVLQVIVLGHIKLQSTNILK